MKKIIILLLTIPLLLLGCSSGTQSTLVDFDHAQLKKQIEVQGFQPKLPAKMPFEGAKAEFSPPPNQQDVLIFDFFSHGEENKNHLGFMIVNGKNSSSDMEFEDVSIGDIKGKYAVNNGDAQILRWKDGDIEYSLTYYGKQSDKEVSKGELIETAKSFE
ncbi:hypothetical protein [Rossellomorea aquimaris]|uniref:hypothetical protein n=1 Tax=Rossellomorea aquimaris TaxID=189382 RepID=UPI0007D0697D|nr:hypothetical protein [Rossellomorea aquimaris]